MDYESIRFIFRVYSPLPQKQKGQKENVIYER